MRERMIVIGAALAVTAACTSGGDEPGDGREGVATPFGDRVVADGSVPDSVRRGQEWRIAAEADRQARGGQAGGVAGSAAARADTVVDAGVVERFEDITPERVTAAPRLPLADTAAGPSVVHVQALLDRAGFSPGQLDGRWGGNTEKAVYWFQEAHALPATGRVDQATYAAIRDRAGAGPAVARYQISPEDAGYAFAPLPESVYEQEELPCLCYTSLAELLAERFHVAPDVLQQLNGNVSLAGLQAGAEITVPNVARDISRPIADSVASILVSKSGSYTQALRADGTIIFHFPSTLGSGYDPSPTGEFEITRVVPNPDFHYQPTLFSDVPDSRPEAWLPPGPNSPVGVMWMELSKPHYGIHGTQSPGTIGYADSHGCIRLTNWDALTLAQHVTPGIAVRFR